MNIDPDTTLFGWARPFDPYDPELPVSVELRGTDASLLISKGCKLSTLIAALQLRGMEKPDELSALITALRLPGIEKPHD